MFKDGILDKNVWQKTSPKIMFLLKENYSEGWHANSPINIMNGTNKKYWMNIARWKYLIMNIVNENLYPDFPRTDDLPEISDNNGYMDDIAYLNINKNLAEKKSSIILLSKIARIHSDQLSDQIDTIDPDIVVCGGTFVHYKEIYENEDIIKISHRVHKHNKRAVINFYHPGYWQIRGGQRELYNRLRRLFKTDVSKNALKNKRT